MKKNCFKTAKALLYHDYDDVFVHFWYDHYYSNNSNNANDI